MAQVFICGCGHSGTSLLAAMFAAHPQVYVPLRETNVFLNLNRAPAAYAALLEEWRTSGKRHLVEKTPRHIRSLDLIRRMAPKVKFVMPVRDGRDVAASIAARFGDRGQLGIDRWLQDTAIVMREQRTDDVLVYRHEDMVQAPMETLERVCDFSGVPFDSSMLSYYTTPRTWFTNVVHEPEHRALRNQQINQPIFDNSGRWRQDLTEAEIAPLLSGEAAEIMRHFGYL